MKKLKVTIIGTGALGSVIARALYEQGITVYSLFNRSLKYLEAIAAEIHTDITDKFPNHYNELGNLIFITTGDQYIAEISDKLAMLSDDFSHNTVVHCSGIETSAILSSLQKKGAAVAAFHPVQTFTKNSVAKDFKNIYFDVEGGEEAKKLLKRIAKKLESHCIEISPGSKPYLHAAAVMASNYLFALVETAAEIAKMGDIDKAEACNVLLPLAHKTMENIADAEHIADALSGPIARGDISTVASHIELLKNNPQILTLYKQLGDKTLKMANRKNTISSEQREKLAKLFQS